MNDLMFNQVLMSDGYVVDFAIGTTYGLDMESLLSIPLTMELMSEITETTMPPHFLMEAIRKSADRFVIFCNAGNIIVPRNLSRVYSLLESCVYQVALPTFNNSFVNFHPKVWVVKLSNPETGISIIKLAVMSRNLTQSIDMDVVCTLEGPISRFKAPSYIRDKHKPLKDFLLWLAFRPRCNTKNKILSLVETLDYIHGFEIDDRRFEDYDFFPMGFSDAYNGMNTCFNTPQFAEHVNQAVIISPFIDSTVLSMLAKAKNKGGKTLITRQEYITQEILEMYNDGVYAVKDTLNDETEEAISLDLHMKIYFINAYGRNYLYLGSTNATRNGFDRNVEFLLGLRFRPNHMSYRIFRQEFINDHKDCRFEKIITPVVNPGTDKNSDEERIIRRFIASIYNAVAYRRKDDETTFDLKVAYEKLRSESPIFLAPLQAYDKEQELGDFEIWFEKIQLIDLCDFYIIKVGKIRRIIKIPTTGIPTNERDTAIFRSFIDTKQKFLNYITFLLADDKEEYVGEQAFIDEIKGEQNNGAQDDLNASLYENMLRAAYTHPDRIKEIAKIISKLDEKVIPAGFIQLYKQFEMAIKQIKKR